MYSVFNGPVQTDATLLDVTGQKKLKLNSGKTEIIVFSSSYRTRPTLKNLLIASDTVDCSTTAKTIGVIFYISLSILPLVTAVCKSSFFFFFSFKQYF